MVASTEWGTFELESATGKNSVCEALIFQITFNMPKHGN
ncbi:protein of unknown function [Vibrio tapetis subsp. tapetis]|uniref:Uncharacterized protein n=1 Tax=Vibrio tapetis subsp. tapetis TaxID=1671868 RepID=A0A2N8ZBM6_9VIBR|nr:protein of unknown function [Vibrio tapetis subsp. tapetis]